MPAIPKDETYPSSYQGNSDKAQQKHSTGKHEKAASRECQEHSFLTDVADVRAMEQGLLQLLDDFHSGKLQAFGGTMTFEKMDQIREQQEKLARLHFEMEIMQDLQSGERDEEGRKPAYEKMSKLIGQLHNISSAIQKMHKE